MDHHLGWGDPLVRRRDGQGCGGRVWRRGTGPGLVLEEAVDPHDLGLDLCPAHPVPSRETPRSESDSGSDPGPGPGPPIPVSPLTCGDVVRVGRPIWIQICAGSGSDSSPDSDPDSDRTQIQIQIRAQMMWTSRHCRAGPPARGPGPRPRLPRCPRRAAGPCRRPPVCGGPCGGYSRGRRSRGSPHRRRPGGRRDRTFGRHRCGGPTACTPARSTGTGPGPGVRRGSFSTRDGLRSR
jgi:hypothetical protein